MFSDLRCAAAQAPSFQLINELHRYLRRKAELNLDGRQLSHSWGSILTDAALSIEERWEFAFFGDKKGAHRFGELAYAAGGCLARVWKHITVGLTPQPLFTVGDATGSWMRAIFLVAWQHRPGSALHALRSTYPELSKTTCFVSVLPINPFLASVILIDNLLEIANVEASPDSNPKDWPKFPFRQRCSERVETDQSTVDAIREVIADWDGKNWIAVREALRATGRAPEELRKMTVFDVRMAFATGQRAIVVALGGRPETATGKIVDVEHSSTDTILSQVELEVLAAVGESKHPPILLVDIEGVSGHGKQATRKALGRLIEVRFVARPVGTARKGYAITREGRQYLLNRQEQGKKAQSQSG